MTYLLALILSSHREWGYFFSLEILSICKITILQLFFVLLEVNIKFRDVLFLLVDLMLDFVNISLIFSDHILDIIYPSNDFLNILLSIDFWVSQILLFLLEFEAAFKEFIYTRSRRPLIPLKVWQSYYLKIK